MLCTIGLNFSNWRDAIECKDVLAGVLTDGCSVEDLLNFIGLDYEVSGESHVYCVICGPKNENIKRGSIQIVCENEDLDDLCVKVAKALATMFNCYSFMDVEIERVCIYSPDDSEYSCSSLQLMEWLKVTGATDINSSDSLLDYKLNDEFILEPERVFALLSGSPVTVSDVSDHPMVRFTDRYIQCFYGIFFFLNRNFPSSFIYKGAKYNSIQDVFDKLEVVPSVSEMATDIVRSFYENNKWLQAMLIATGNRELIDYDYSDDSTGWEFNDYTGDNYYGEVVMKVRGLLKDSKAVSEDVHNECVDGNPNSVRLSGNPTLSKLTL